MSASETRVSSFTNESLEPSTEGTEHPQGVSALVSRLNFSSSGSDAGSQGSPDVEGCGSEEQRQEKNFPWLSSFSQQCRAAIGSKSIKQLDDLLSIYIEHVTPHYRDCHKLPNKAAKLKRNINDTMIFFHMLYMDIREPLENAFYYDKMTELMAMYLDLEITASRRGKDTEKTVTNKLSTSLYTFLDYSEDHILDALLKTKLINKHSKKVCVPLLRKVLSELVVRRPLAELTYVRFLLSFKLWKNVVADVEERRAINKLAAQRLHPPPEYFQDHDIAKPNAEVLPRVPKTKKNCTSFYMGAKFSVKDACRAFFRFCKDKCRSNVYRRNISGSDEVDKPFLITSRSNSERIIDVEESGSCSLINDIWSTISNGDSSSCLLGESDMFGDVYVAERKDTFSLEIQKKKRLSPESVNPRMTDTSERIRRKEIKKKKENSVPDPKFVMPKTEGVPDPIIAPSPAKGVQDCCLGSVFMMEQVNNVGGGKSHVKADPCEAELPTSSRQHSVLESLVYAQPGSDNEAVASSSVSPDAGSVPTSHLDTNECDSSVEILQSRKVSADVSLPLELKPGLNIDEDLRAGKVEKEDLLLFSETDHVADDGGGCFESPFSDFNMFRLNEELFPCRNSFEGMDQSSMMYRRSDVTGSLPFQGSPLLEEDDDEFVRGFRWSSVPDYHPSIQSTIINQSSGSGPSSDPSLSYAGLASKDMLEEKEEPKLGQDFKQGKGTAQGTLWQTVLSGGKVIRVPADVYARYRQAYFSHVRSRSLSQPQSIPPSQSETNSNSLAIQMSLPPDGSSTSVAEGSDNLKILAEEAVRVREASVAEAKSKSDLAANLNLPLKKRKSLPHVSDAVVSDGESMKYTVSYTSTPMLSIAQIQGLTKSVIVMNSQYSCPSVQSVLPSATHEKNSIRSCIKEVNISNCKPIDMSAAKNPTHFSNSNPGIQSFTSTGGNLSLSTVCKLCRIATCQGRCQISNKTNVHVKKSLNCCAVENCGGRCEVKKQTSVKYTSTLKALKCAVCKNTGCSGNCNGFRGSFSSSDKSGRDKTSDRNCKIGNNLVQKPRHSSSAAKCSHCQVMACKGQCKPSASICVKDATQDMISKAVLKCFQCKLPGCNGKCMTSHSRCSTASSRGRQSFRCLQCGSSSCYGLCKTTESKCPSCLIHGCKGKCLLTGRSTNNSLSTVNDFSILKSSAFVDAKSKCGLCKNICCGSCKNVSGYKYCPYCANSVSNGSNLSHSMKSILGNGSKAKVEVDASMERPPKRGKASSGRRTRSSSSSKHNLSLDNECQSFSVEDVKRRKKSLPKSVGR